ncbi:MAG: two-component sensor histidine kinase [Betaproteobacteria bacterium HGW-Betaproteobacteria-6]|jgi:two-component system osmolarity sensor histidine kinase EnvZ|nr:MAG: two-component sensor histidine kinase [Betaproteobacteria bacterium HGW-Betaproteobacteria-6]
MPRTLLARTFLLLAMLVLLTTAGWLSLFRHIDAEPRARETAQLAASAVNLIRASLFAAAPVKRLGLFNEFSRREGIRLLPAEPEDKIEAMPDSRFFRLLQGELTARLGEHTRIAASVDGVSGFWVSFRLDDADEEEYWLVLPRERAARDFASHWLAWGLLAVVLALAVAWLIASRISRPLKAMARSAETVGRGEKPEPLPEDGAEELSRLAVAFNTMAADLERHERDRSEVLAGISHDLRTPLTRLRLEAEMSVADSARQAVVADIEQMEAVISQFMDYARTESGEAPVATDLGALLSGIAERQRSVGHALTTSIDDLPEMLLRPKAITRAVTNLIDNAVKYGGGEITLSAATVNGEIQVEISDRGPGIPPDQIERLKRPFTRLESARTDVTGTGLGLAIVERIAKLHDGHLDLLPHPGGGLLVRLLLPIRS